MRRNVATAENVEDDPKATLGRSQSRSAAGSCQHRGVLSFPSEAQKLRNSRNTHLGNETARVHHANRRLGDMAAGGAGARVRFQQILTIVWLVQNGERQ
jgi:hypothetical protein